MKGDPYDTCAICLDDYMEGEKLRILPCAHGKYLIIYFFFMVINNTVNSKIYYFTAYHCKCIDPWLTRNRRFCPICKRRVYGDNDDLHAVAYSSDTDSDEPNDRTPLVTSRSNNSNSLGVGALQEIYNFRVSDS